MAFLLKYKPLSSKEILGQETALSQMDSFIENSLAENSKGAGKNRKGKRKGMLLYGPPGTGKTSSVCAFAKEKNLELVEINASDYRNPAEIEEKVGRAIKQASLFFKGKLILIDEIDGLSGRKDRGAIPAIAKIIENSPYPVFLTANSPEDKKFKTLRKKCIMVEFKKIPIDASLKVLEKICKKENITYKEEDLKQLIRRNDGDLRASINDLEILGVGGALGNTSLLNDFERDRVEKIQNALFLIFKSKKQEITASCLNNIEEDIPEIMLWIDENLPKEYKDPESLKTAYEFLSLADLFYGRIKKWQHWRFLVYCYLFLSYGIASSKRTKNPERIEYKRSSRILELWKAKMKNMKKKSVAEKLSLCTHSSTKTAFENFAFLLPALKNNPSLAEELELSKEEKEWVYAKAEE